MVDVITILSKEIIDDPWAEYDTTNYFVVVRARWDCDGEVGISICSLPRSELLDEKEARFTFDIDPSIIDHAEDFVDNGWKD